MKVHFGQQIKNASSLLSRAMLGLLLLCGSAHASSFHIYVDTSSLIGDASGPFSLDFQFNNGSVLGNNTASITNFAYSGGGAIGSAASIGGALGDIASSVLFNNSAPFQELYQTFMPGGILSFDVFLTSNVDAGTPDAFAFGILDKDLFNIPTTGLGDSLVLVNLSSSSPTIQTFSGTGPYAGVKAYVPETETYLLMMAGLPLLAFAARKKQLAA